MNPSTMNIIYLIICLSCVAVLIVIGAVVAGFVMSGVNQRQKEEAEEELYDEAN